MPGTDLGYSDLPFASAADAKAELITYTENIVNGLQGGAKGKKAAKKDAKPELKRTDKRVKIGSVERTVFTGARGGKYVKLNGKIVPLSEAKKKK